jgi:hypothetical protein
LTHPLKASFPIVARDLKPDKLMRFGHPEKQYIPREVTAEIPVIFPKPAHP